MIDTSSRPDASRAFGPRASDRNILLAAKGGGIIFVGTLFAYGSRLVIGILLARLLGAERYGLYTLTLTTGEIAASLALLGLESALVRYVSLFASQRDTAGLWGTLQVGLVLPAIVSLLLGIGLYALATPIAEQLFHEPRLVPLLRLASLIVPFSALANITAAATRGFNKMEYTVIAQKISQPMVKLILVGVLAMTGLTVAKAVTAYSLGVVTVFMMLLYFLNLLFPLRRPLRTARRDIREMLRFALPVYLSALIGTFGGNLQTMLLGALNSVMTVGIFAVASRVSELSRIFNLSIGIASMPIVSELYSRGEREQVARFYQTTTKWTFTLNLPLFLVVLLFPGPILAIFGGDFVGGAAALTLLAWANLVLAGTGTCGVVLDMTGNTSLKLVNSIVLFGLTLGLNVLLIPHWGVVGAAAAALAATAAASILCLTEVFVLFRLLPYNMSFVKPVAAGLVALAVAWFIRHLFHAEANLVHTAINAIIILAVYVGMISLLGLSPEDRAVLAHLRRRMGTVARSVTGPTDRS